MDGNSTLDNCSAITLFTNSTSCNNTVDLLARCQRRSVDTNIAISVFFYGLVCAVGLLGNGLVIFVITKYTKMKTVTNMYILNLSVADTMFLLGLPLVMTMSIIQNWIFGTALCKIYYAQTCINMFVGSFTLAAMAGDRFLAVCYPISSMKYRTPKYSLIVIAVIWLFSCMAMIPVVIFAVEVSHPRCPGKYSCAIQWPAAHQATSISIFLAYTLILGFAAPVLIISILYILLVVRLRTSGPQVKSAEKRRSHRKVTKLVSLIITVYIICWLPYWAFQIHILSSGMKVSLPDWQVIMFSVFTTLSYANSMINPFLYAFTNDNFRESFISAFRCVSDPILGSRRGSEYYSTGNNNSVAESNARRIRKEPASYEFTVLTNGNDDAETKLDTTGDEVKI